MKRTYFILCVFYLSSYTAQVNTIKFLIEALESCYIESFPMNRVYIDYGDEVFSFEVPRDLVIFRDTALHAKMAVKLGFNRRHFIPSKFLFTGDFIISNKSGTKLLKSSFQWRMCGLDSHPSEFPKDFCQEKRYGDERDFKELMLYDETRKVNFWKRSMKPFPFSKNPMFSFPHDEYRQCYRYSQSLFMAFLKVKEESNQRFFYATILTIIPDQQNYKVHEFEYYALDYNRYDILRMKRIMNSIQYVQNKKHFSIYEDDPITDENITLVKEFPRNAEEYRTRMQRMLDKKKRDFERGIL